MLLVMGRGPADLQEVIEAVDLVSSVCDRLDPSVVGLIEAPAMFDQLVRLQKLAAGAVVRMTARYEEAGAWKRNGARSPEEDIARKTGSSRGAARRDLGTSKALGAHPKTEEAVRKGELSPDQASEVAAGASASPRDEDALLRSARKDPLHELKRKAAEARARADDDREATRRRQHRMRSVRRWQDAEGMGNLLLRLPGDAMAEVDAALKFRIDKAYADARDRGQFEDWENYAADVVRELLTSQCSTGARGGSGGTVGNQAVRPDKKVIALIDVAALNRGRVEGDETCEIAGVGPVSVSAIRSLLSEAFLSMVIKDGVDIRNVTHLGRQVTAHQRTAIEARGGRCEICGSTHMLEIDHGEGWCFTHETRLDDLFLECHQCHDVKTRYHLLVEGPPGRRRFTHRDGQPWRGPPERQPARGEPRDEPAQDDLFTTAS